ncbi:putative reverse transcriptase domain-containing protein [Tanacetum coccineum]
MYKLYWTNLIKTINPIAAQEVSLDNALVAPENRVRIGKYNIRIDPTKTPKESTYQVVLDALALTTCYPAFLITAKICHRLPNQEFVVPPSSDEDIVSFIKELRYSGDIDSVSKVYTYHMHQPWRTFAAVINKCLFGKTTVLDKIRLSRAQILKIQNSTAYKTYLAFATGATTPKKVRKFKKSASPSKKKTLVAIDELAEKPAKKPAARRQSAGVQIRDTPGVSVSKKKASAKAERSKGIELLSEVALLEEARLKKAIKRSKQTESDNNKGDDLNKIDNEEEDVHTPKDYIPTDDENVDDEEYDRINKKLYDDMNVELKDVETADEGKSDEEMTHYEKVDAEHENINQEVAGDQVKDDAQAIVTTTLATQKTEVPLESSSILSDYATKFLNFDNIPPADTKITLMMDIKVHHEDLSSQTSSLFIVPVLVIPESPTTQATTIPPPIPPFILFQQQSTPIPTPTITEATISTINALDSTTLTAIHQRLSDLENKFKTLRNVDHSSAIRATIKSKVPTVVKEYLGTSLDDTLHKHKALYHALMESILDDEDAMDQCVADKLKKRKSDDADRDECPPAGPDQRLEVKTTEDIISIGSFIIMEFLVLNQYSTGTSKGTIKSQPKSTGKSYQAEEIVFKTADTQVSQNIGEDTSNTDELPVVNAIPKDWFMKPERPLTLDPEWNACKTVDNKPTKKWLSDLAKAEKYSKTFNDLMSTSIDFTAFAMNRLEISDLTQDILVGPAYKILKGTFMSYVKLEYNMEEYYKALNNQLDWNNLEGDRYPFDLSKPRPLIELRNRQIVPTDYFFNNDLAYLQGGSTGRTYTTSLTKTKAAKYDLQGIEDMLPNLWSLVKVAYDKHALLGTSHWRSKRQTFYGYARNKVSKHDVYSTKIILAVINVKVNDMLLLIVQNRLFNLKGEDIVHLAAALRMFTRRIVIQKRVEYLQLGVESYQKKLNISRTLTHRAGITNLAPYTTYSNPQGFIYLDKLERNILMCFYELYKFSDGTLISVQDKLKDMANNLEMGYTSVMPRSRWSNLEKKRYRCSFPRSSQNRRDLPRDIPLDRIEVYRYDTKGVKVRKGIMQTKTKLTLEQTQQGVSDEVLIHIKMDGGTWFQQESKIHSHMLILDRHIDEVLKLKNFKKDNYTSFQNQEKYEHVSPKVTSIQDGKSLKDDDKRQYLADDLKKLKDHMQVKHKGTSSSLKIPGLFQGYETSEEESVERPKERDLHRFVDHPQLQQGNIMNEFAPHRLPQPRGNINGWLTENEEEVERDEVDSDLESTASSKPGWEKTTEDDHDRASRGSTTVKGGIYNYGGQHNYTCATTHVDLQKMAPNRQSGPSSSNNNENPNITTVIAQQLQAIITQVANNTNNANNGNNSGGNGNDRNNRCSFKTFQSFNPKEYDGKGGAIALTRWIEKMENVIDNSGCAKNQKVRYATSSLVNKALTWWNTQCQARGRVAAIAMSWNDFKALMVEEFCPTRLAPEIRGMLRATQPTTILNAILRAGILTDEAVSCGTLTKGSDKRKGVEEPSKTGGSWKDNKKAKMGTGFVASAPPRNETVGYNPRCSKCYTHHPENRMCRLCFNCQKQGHFAKDCRALNRQVALVNAVRMNNNPRVCHECGSPDHFRNTCPKLNQAPRQTGNQLAIEGSRNNRSNGNQVRGRAYNVNVNAMEAVQDPNVVTGTFSLNDHFVTVLFNSGANFSFVSTKFAPLLNVKPSIVNPGYVIEVADGKKVEVDRIIRDCKLELGGSLFSINLIPLGHGSFDVIVGMD